MSATRGSRVRSVFPAITCASRRKCPARRVPNCAGSCEVRNRFAESCHVEADELISTDALALVRFGLRAADDPRMVDTVKVIDHVLRVELPYGPGWRRYNGDGYGEHDDGNPYDGTGVGRVWPLLAGERAHYELAAGRRAEAQKLLTVLEAGASPGKLLPEQVWDGAPIPALELEPGEPSGSAMPLVWAHAEHIKLLRSLADGTVFDRPPQPVRRYLREQQTARCRPWRPDWRTPGVPAGRTLRLDLPEPALVHWSTDGWKTRVDVRTRDTGLGIHTADLPTDGLTPGRYDCIYVDEPGQWRMDRPGPYGDGASRRCSQAAGIASASRPPTRTGSIRRASPVASSVSTNTPHTVASPSAGASRSPGILRQNRSVAASFAMPITLS